MKIAKNIFWLILSAQLVSCEKQSVAPAYNEEPVIEGYLYANNLASIRITSQIAVSEATSGAGEGIDTLQVFIDVDSGSHQLTNAGNGTYQDSTLIIVPETEYTLHFKYRGKIVTASTKVPSLPKDFTQSATELSLTKIESTTTFTPGSFQMNDPIDLNWENADKSYYMIVVQNTDNQPELIRDTTSVRFRVANFRNEPAIIDQYQIRDMQFQYFGNYTMTLFHLNEDYAALYSDNSSSSQNLTNPTSNITNGLGIFTGISTDTLLFKVHKK